jgi:ParB family chromosome partitioning protein
MVLPNGNAMPGGELVYLSAEMLEPDPNQPRQSMEEAFAEKLTDSIRKHGIKNPLRVRRNLKTGKFTILGGWQRFVCGHQRAGLKVLPCLIVEGEWGEAEVLEDQIIDNGVRNPIAPCQEARAWARLMTLRGWNGKELADRLGEKSPAAVSRKLALLDLVPANQERVDQRLIPESAGAELARVTDPELQLQLGERIASGKLTRDDLISEVQKVVGKRQVRPEGTKAAFKIGELRISLSSDNKPLSIEGITAALAELKKGIRKIESDGSGVPGLVKLFANGSK